MANNRNTAMQLAKAAVRLSNTNGVNVPGLHLIGLDIGGYWVWCGNVGEERWTVEFDCDDRIVSAFKQ